MCMVCTASTRSCIREQSGHDCLSNLYALSIFGVGESLTRGHLGVVMYTNGVGDLHPQGEKRMSMLPGTALIFSEADGDEI
jgi:hypothetical protein